MNHNIQGTDKMEQEKPVKGTTKMVNDKKEQSEEKGMMTQLIKHCSKS